LRLRPPLAACGKTETAPKALIKTEAHLGGGLFVKLFYAADAEEGACG
jgi:hypothetical protein